jgi:hypothetical protein
MRNSMFERRVYAYMRIKLTPVHNVFRAQTETEVRLDAHGYMAVLVRRLSTSAYLRKYVI